MSYKEIIEANRGNNRDSKKGTFIDQIRPLLKCSWRDKKENVLLDDKLSRDGTSSN